MATERTPARDFPDDEVGKCSLTAGTYPAVRAIDRVKVCALPFEPVGVRLTGGRCADGACIGSSKTHAPVRTVHERYAVTAMAAPAASVMPVWLSFKQAEFQSETAYSR